MFAKGTIGRVTVPIDKVYPGQVLLPYKGGTVTVEAFASHTKGPLAVDTPVKVIEQLDSHIVLVEEVIPNDSHS